MKKMKKLLCLLLSLLCLLGGAALAQDMSLWNTQGMDAAADAAESEPQFPFLAETDELAVNLRAEMSTKAKRVGRLERGTQLTVLSADLNAAGEVWYAVQLKDGTQGYIRSDLLVRSEEPMAVSMAVYTGSVLGGGNTAAEPETFKAKVTQNAVNVRTQASTSSGKAGKVARGDILLVLSQVVNDANEIWYNVQLEDGTQGYIRSDLLIEADEEDIQKASYQAPKSKSSSYSVKKSSGSGNYIGNKNTKKFHRSSCHTLPKESNRVYFSSREKARSSGYVPCKNCDP